MNHPVPGCEEGRDRDARAGRREGGQRRHRSGDCPSERPGFGVDDKHWVAPNRGLNKEFLE